MTAKDKVVANSRIPDSDPVRENELSIQSSVRTHADDVERKRIANSEVQKVEDNQKTMNKKRLFVKSEIAKEQSQKNEARNNLQDLIQKAESALDNAQDLIKQSKLANQKAHAPLEEAKSRQKETPKDQEEHINIESSELSELSTLLKYPIRRQGSHRKNIMTCGRWLKQLLKNILQSSNDVK